VRGLGIGSVNQKLGSRLGILSAVLTLEAIAYSFIVIMRDPLEPIIGVDNETNAPQSSKDRMGEWINQNVQTLRWIAKAVRISYIRLAIAIFTAGLAVAVIISLKNRFIFYLILIDIFFVAIGALLIGVTCYLMGRV